jgi:Na+/citrate or Na+/malate symporter
VVNQPYEQKEVTRVHEQDLPAFGEIYLKLGDDSRVGPVSGQILGMKRTNFWRFMIAIVIIVVAAAIGGAVGGSLAGKKQGHVSEHQPPKFCG